MTRTAQRPALLIAVALMLPIGLTCAAMAVPVVLAPAASAAPSTGTCYQLSDKALGALTSGEGPVPCSEPHNAETFFVGTVPETITDPQTATPPQIVDAVLRECTSDRLRAYLGLTDPLPSRFVRKAFFPTPEAWTAGDRSLRCDLTLRSGKGRASWPGPAPAYVAASPAGAFRYCTPSVGFLAWPDPNKPAAEECTNPPRQWIQVGNQALGKPTAKYPGEAKLRRRGSAVCRTFRATYPGGIANPENRGWYFIFPKAAGWRAGERDVQCWVPLKQFLDTPGHP